MADAMIDAPILAPVIARQIVVTGGNCFQIASEYLGDAKQVDRIMSLNPQLLGDPWISGVQTINLPDVDASAGTGGIIAATPGPAVFPSVQAGVFVP